VRKFQKKAKSNLNYAIKKFLQITQIYPSFVMLFERSFGGTFGAEGINKPLGIKWREVELH
jgi:hypothetical protein